MVGMIWDDDDRRSTVDGTVRGVTLNSRCFQVFLLILAITFQVFSLFYAKHNNNIQSTAEPT